MFAGSGIENALLLRDKFSIVSLIILALTVPVVFWLAVFRPALGREQ